MRYQLDGLRLDQAEALLRKVASWRMRRSRLGVDLMCELRQGSVGGELSLD